MFRNEKLTIATKMKILGTYIEPIFMYNSEIWTLTKTQEQSIDAFQRTLIRNYVFGIKWPKTISNEQLYQKSKATSWKQKITLRRLKWFGKLANKQEVIPAKSALKYGLNHYSRPPGKPKTTWISKMKSDLKMMNLSWDDAENIAREDINEWNRIVEQYVKTA